MLYTLESGSNDRNGEASAVSTAPDEPLGTLRNHARPPDDHRSARYELQAAAKAVRWWSLRLRACGRVPVLSGRGPIVVLRQSRASYRGLQTCGSVWECPCCASKVSEKKRLDLVAAVAAHRARGGRVLLLTLTVPHYAGQRLALVKRRLWDARRRFRNRPGWKRLKAALGIIGEVTARELTYSPANGWHVHTHELLFLRGSPEILELERELLELWKAACLAAGLPEPNRHGVDIRGGNFAAAYAAKWGLEHELTYGHSKRARGPGGLSPFDLLRAFAETGDEEFGVLFNEYADEFRGVRQLCWSKGLRAKLGLAAERSDTDLAAADGDGGGPIGEIDAATWRIVYAAGARVQVLRIAESYGWPGVTRFLDRLRADYGICEFLIRGPDDLEGKLEAECKDRWYGFQRVFGA